MISNNLEDVIHVQFYEKQQWHNIKQWRLGIDYTICIGLLDHVNNGLFCNVLCVLYFVQCHFCVINFLSFPLNVLILF